MQIMVLKDDGDRYNLVNDDRCSSLITNRHTDLIMGTK